MATDDLKARLLVNLVGSASVMVPFAGSMIAFATAMIVQHPGNPLFAGILGILTTAGVVGYRVAFKMDDIRADVIKEVEGLQGQKEQERRREADLNRARVEGERDRMLDDLRRRLLADDDDRTEDYLDELRDLAAQFRGDKPWMQKLLRVAAEPIEAGVEDLFQSSVRHLGRSLELYESGMLDERERKLELVRQNLETLREMLGGIKGLEAEVEGSDEDDDARKRRDLLGMVESARQASAPSGGPGKARARRETDGA